MDIDATYHTFLTIAPARARHINTPLKALSSFLPSLTSFFIGPKHVEERSMGALPPHSPKPNLEHSHVLCPPSFFQKITERCHDCSSSPSLDRSQKVYHICTCLAFSSKRQKTPLHDSSFRLLWTASEKHSGVCHVLFLPPKCTNVPAYDCGFRLLWIISKSLSAMSMCCVLLQNTRGLRVWLSLPPPALD